MKAHLKNIKIKQILLVIKSLGIKGLCSKARPPTEILKKAET